MISLALNFLHTIYRSVWQGIATVLQTMQTTNGSSEAFPSLNSQLVMPAAGSVPVEDKKQPTGNGQQPGRPKADLLVEDEVTNFDWTWLCMPRLPCFKEPEVPPFYGVHAKLPLPVAIIMGFQHALAMMGGIITPPLLVSGAFYARFSNEESQYIVAVGLICSGILTWAQVYQVKLFRGLVLGTGMISVVGTSFVFVPIAESSINYMMTTDSPASCQSDADCTRAWAGQFGSLAGVVIPGVTNAGQCNLVSHKCKYRCAAPRGFDPLRCVRALSLAAFLLSSLGADVGCGRGRGAAGRRRTGPSSEPPWCAPSCRWACPSSPSREPAPSLPLHSNLPPRFAAFGPPPVWHASPPSRLAPSCPACSKPPTAGRGVGGASGALCAAMTRQRRRLRFP